MDVKEERDEMSVTSLLTEQPAKRVKVEEDETPIPNHSTPPVHEMVGGSSVRQYLNKHLTQHLLEGLRDVSKRQPQDPLRELGEFLVQRAKELES